MVSLVWDNRALPISWQLLLKIGSTSYLEQQAAIKKHKIVILGDREFCSVDLGNWRWQQGVYFCWRLKRNEYVQSEKGIWCRLDTLGLAPESLSVFFWSKSQKKEWRSGF